MSVSDALDELVAIDVGSGTGDSSVLTSTNNVGAFGLAVLTADTMADERDEAPNTNAWGVPSTRCVASLDTSVNGPG